MSNASHTSNESRHSLMHMPDVPSSPEPSKRATSEVLLQPTAASLTRTLVADNEQEGMPFNPGPITGFIDLTSDEYPPVSPGSAETILALDPTINATIRATAYGLITTVCKRTTHQAQELAKACQNIERLEQLNQQQAVDNCQLQA
jgi:hypothetical protein